MQRCCSSMARFIDLQRLQSDLASGNRLRYNAALQILVLKQLERILETEVIYINRLIYLQEDQMKEVHDLATGMKELIASIKRDSANAKGALVTEAMRAKDNAAKVHSIAADLKEANKEVEEFLGETGSNFPPAGETLNTPAVKPKTDINGVTLNPEATK